MRTRRCVVSILFICAFIFYIPLANSQAKGHLNEKLNNFYVSIRENSKDTVLKNYAIQYGCPDDRATTIARVLVNYQTKQSREWANRFIGENWDYTFEFFSALYVFSHSQNPPSSISNELYKRQIPITGVSRNLSNFWMNLETFAKASYPKNHLEPRYHILVMKGLKAALSDEETKTLLHNIEEDMNNNSTLYELTLPIWAYINQTGDVLFITKLWDLDPKGGKFLCLQLAEAASDEDIVKNVLALSETLDESQDEGSDRLRAALLGIFHEQKRVPGVGERIRRIIAHPGYFQDHIQTLVTILGDEGWPMEELHANKTTLESFLKKLEFSKIKAEISLQRIHEQFKIAEPKN